MTSVELISDAELVAACLAGDREAFSRIVVRHQGLLCSLAYSATGSLSESEALAQEAFVMLADPHAPHFQILLVAVIALLSMVPIAVYARAVRRRLGGGGRSNG